MSKPARAVQEDRQNTDITYKRREILTRPGKETS